MLALPGQIRKAPTVFHRKRKKNLAFLAPCARLWHLGNGMGNQLIKFQQLPITAFIADLHLSFLPRVINAGKSQHNEDQACCEAVFVERRRYQRSNPVPKESSVDPEVVSYVQLHSWPRCHPGARSPDCAPPPDCHLLDTAVPAHLEPPGLHETWCSTGAPKAF